MAVKRVPGLYFIGEVVDVTGQLGGYNFQWAWASGYAAGQSRVGSEQSRTQKKIGHLSGSTMTDENMQMSMEEICSDNVAFAILNLPLNVKASFCRLLPDSYFLPLLPAYVLRPMQPQPKLIIDRVQLRSPV